MDTEKLESESRMKKERRSKYPPEYKRRIVDLVRTGRKPASLAAEYGVHYSTILTWVKEADAVAVRNLDGVDPGDQTELVRLRERVAELEEEREILKKASAWFAQEASRTSSRRGGS
jgi:transposase